MPANVSVELLADHPNLIPAVGALRWREWGHPPEPERLEWWVNVTGRETGRETLPMTWVAIGKHDQALGAVGLGEFDIDERRDRSPWVLGMIVDVPYRGSGIGRQLIRALETWAHQQGYPQVWVATGGPAVEFYQACGWKISESLTRLSGERASILTKLFG